MRVIAGTFRSKLLKSPGKLRLRPTSDRLREPIFKILGPAVEDSLFVALYAGTGAIGIEAISRGAKETIFVESHAVTARLIRANLDVLKIESGAEVIEAAALRGLERIASRHLLADFIFLHPPYEDEGGLSDVLDYLDISHVIAPLGMVIVEHRDKVDMPERLQRLERTRLVEQGDAALSFYRLAAAA